MFSSVGLIWLANPFSSSLKVQHGATSSRKPSWIGCLDSGYHLGLISALGGFAPGGHCLSLLCLPTRQVCPFTAVFPSTQHGARHGGGAQSQRTKVGLIPSTMRTLCSVCRFSATPHPKSLTTETEIQTLRLSLAPMPFHLLSPRSSCWALSTPSSFPPGALSLTSLCPECWPREPAIWLLVF